VRRFQKAADLGVDARLGTSKVVYDRLNAARRHIAMTIENVAEDEGEVYDVGHHEADILIPEEEVVGLRGRVC
jgi:hypothetical protein